MAKYNTKQKLDRAIICEVIITLISLVVIFLAKDASPKVQNLISAVCEGLFGIFAIILCYLSVKMRREKKILDE